MKIWEAAGGAAGPAAVDETLGPFNVCDLTFEVRVGPGRLESTHDRVAWGAELASGRAAIMAVERPARDALEAGMRRKVRP